MGWCPCPIFCRVSKDLFSSTGTYWGVGVTQGVRAHLGSTDIPRPHLWHTQLNCDVPVPVSGLITSQMLFQGSWAELKHEPGWHLLSSYRTRVWITFPEQKLEDPQDRSSVRRDWWKFLLWATLCHLAIEKWVQKGSGNVSDLAINTGDTYARGKRELVRALQWQKPARPSELHQQQPTHIFS